MNPFNGLLIQLYHCVPHETMWIKMNQFHLSFPQTIFRAKEQMPHSDPKSDVIAKRMKTTPPIRVTESKVIVKVINHMSSFGSQIDDVIAKRMKTTPPIRVTESKVIVKVINNHMSSYDLTCSN